MINLIYYMISIFLSFLLFTDSEIHTHSTTELPPPCSIEDVTFLENYDFGEYDFLSDFNEIEENANLRCWEDVNGPIDNFTPEDSCYMIGGCPGNNSNFCDGVCETKNGCTICWICTGSYP